MSGGVPGVRRVGVEEAVGSVDGRRRMRGGIRRTREGMRHSRLGRLSSERWERDRHWGEGLSFLLAVRIGCVLVQERSRERAER